jgi:hypothetical protein
MKTSMQNIKKQYEKSNVEMRSSDKKQIDFEELRKK